MGEMESQKRKQILKLMLDHAVELSSSYQNFEHQQFLRMWIETTGRDRYVEEQELKSHLADWQQYYQGVGVQSEFLSDVEIMRICNLFAHGVQAIHDRVDEVHHTPHTILKDRRG